jgi:hypothetical protein
MKVKSMKKTWIMLLTGMLVIGLIPGAMANPKIDSNSQAQNEKQLTVTVDGANAADAAINQILTNNGAQDNHNAGIGGNANAISGNIATLNQNAGNDNLLSGCNGGGASGVAGQGVGTGNGAGNGVGTGTGGAGGNGGSDNLAEHHSDAGNGGAADGAGKGEGAGAGIGAGKGGSSPAKAGNGGSGCNSNSNNFGEQDQKSDAKAIGGEGNSGDVDQSNTVKQDALAEIDVHQSLTQPVDIREFQVANAHEDSSIDLDIPVFDNMDSMIEIEKENPIVENTDKNQN